MLDTLPLVFPELEATAFDPELIVLNILLKAPDIVEGDDAELGSEAVDVEFGSTELFISYVYDGFVRDTEGLGVVSVPQCIENILGSFYSIYDLLMFRCLFHWKTFIHLNLSFSLKTQQIVMDLSFIITIRVFLKFQINFEAHFVDVFFCNR